MSDPAVRQVLHCAPAAIGESLNLRIEAVIEGLGAGWRHELTAADRKHGDRPASLATGGLRVARDVPAAIDTFGPRRLVRLAQAMQGYDLVLGYGWPAIGLAMAHTLYRDAMGLPPLIHVETGEGWNVRAESGLWRKWYRRLAFGKVAGVVAGDPQIEAVALREWQQLPGRVHHIPVGTDTAAFARAAQPDALRVVKHAGECWAGSIAPLEPGYDWERLLKALAGLPPHWQLVIVGEGQARDAILASAVALELSHRVHLPGPARDLGEALSLFDIFVLPPAGGSQPLRVAEAMAAGLPLAGTLGAAIADMPCEANRALAGGADRPEPLASQFAALAEDSELRRELGEANRARAHALYDRAGLVAGMRRLCLRVAG